MRRWGTLRIPSVAKVFSSANELHEVHDRLFSVPGLLPRAGQMRDG